MMTWNSFMFLNPSSSLMEVVTFMHDYVMLMLFTVLIFVSMNMLYLLFFNHFCLEFFEHHTLESAWTISPFLILSFIVVPSLKSLYMLDSCLFCGMSLNVMGHQWYWSYFYKDFGVVGYDSYMLPSADSQVRLTEVDNRLVVPSETPVRFLVSSSDVIHSWTLPSFGLKMDAIPGRINQFCFSSNREGVFFGQCSEICGSNHSFMPIVMESVSFKDFFSVI